MVRQQLLQMIHLTFPLLFVLNCFSTDFFLLFCRVGFAYLRLGKVVLLRSDGAGASISELGLLRMALFSPVLHAGRHSLYLVSFDLDFIDFSHLLLFLMYGSSAAFVDGHRDGSLRSLFGGELRVHHRSHFHRR